MSRKIDDLRQNYINWLEPQLRDDYGNPDKDYWGLTHCMFQTPFIWSHPMDENRMVDGKELRIVFANTFKSESRRARIINDISKIGPTSFLEVLLGLSQRLSFHAGGRPPGWAWHLLCNLELDRLSDPFTRAKQRRAEDIMRVAMERTYSPDGTGGFFPLAWPEDDMTGVELWYQMHAYIAELHPEHMR